MYVKDGISKDKLLKMLKKQQECKTDIHSLIMYQGDELLVRVGVNPYTPTQQRQLYSLSKSFAATAIGIACDKGLLSVNDRVIDIFPEYTPTQPSPYWEEMTVHHVLTMNTGHAECTMYHVARSDDGAQAFFNCPLVYKPGTHFTYNTGATYMLSAIITKLTGETLFDFLYENLFYPLDIRPEKWLTSGGDLSEGGIGLFLSCDDVAKLGLLYLNNGIYQGKRLLSEEWIKTAQLPHSDNSENGTADWTCGYGYQLWRNSRRGYRGDGAMGQYCLILPDDNITLTTLTESFDMQTQMDILFDYIEDFSGTDEVDIDLETELKNIYPPAQYSAQEAPAKHNGLYKLDSNPQGFTKVALKCTDSEIRLDFSDGSATQTVIAGNGSWVENRIAAPAWKPTLIWLMPPMRVEEASFMASARVADGKIVMDIRYTNCPHKGDYTIELGDNTFDFYISHVDGTIYPEAKHLHGERIL